MPSTYASLTPTVERQYAKGHPAVAPNTFIRDTTIAGFAILVGRTKSSFVVEGRAGRTGRNVRVTLGTVGKLALDDARRLAKAEIAKLAAGADVVAELRAKRDARKVDALTFAAALDDLEAAGKVKASTMADYRRSIAALAWLDWRIGDVKPADVRKAYEERIGTPTSAGRIMRSLRSVWNYARGKHPTLPAWPSDELRKVRKRWATAPRRTRVVPDALLPKWRRQVRALERDDVRDFILLMHYTGMRVGEVRALDADHVSLATGRFLVAEPKNGRPVELPIVKQVAPILRRRINAVDEGPLFPFGDVRKSHATVDATPWSYHDLRRQYVTAAHRCGIDDLIARRLTNHAVRDDDAHAGYVVLDADALRPFAQKVADWLDACGKGGRHAR